MDLTQKTDKQIDVWITNHEDKSATNAPLYRSLLEERVRRTQAKHKLDFGKSLALLKQAAIEQRCTSYGDLAKASGVDWSQARHQMNGPNGHLDRLLDICHAQSLPVLTAICVNQNHLEDGELGDEALTGFISGVQRLGFAVTDARAFHHECRNKCWQWGRDQSVP